LPDYSDLSRRGRATYSIPSILAGRHSWGSAKMNLRLALSLLALPCFALSCDIIFEMSCRCGMKLSRLAYVLPQYNCRVTLQYINDWVVHQ
jgi:hypothetical protein